jgi:hypothetical protein
VVQRMDDEQADTVLDVLPLGVGYEPLHLPT